MPIQQLPNISPEDFKTPEGYQRIYHFLVDLNTAVYQTLIEVDRLGKELKELQEK